MTKALVIVALVALPAVATSVASAGPSELPPNWHVHDGQLSLGPEQGDQVLPGHPGRLQRDCALTAAGG